jgi:hypothetical protein
MTAVLPNFMIIGAAKCGTTSLYHYLGQHREIYLSRIKEPKYFALAGQRVSYGGPGDQEDMEKHSVRCASTYAELFRDARPGQAVGEASTLYLYDTNAARRIRDAIPDVRLIAVLRNPAERAYSNFLYMIRRGNEPLRDFGLALAEEERRIAQQWMPTWHYRRRGLYAEQLRRYRACFRPDQLKIYLYEDFTARPQALIADICRFLGVNDRFAPELSARHNVSGRPRSERLHRFMARSGGIKTWVRSCLPAPAARAVAARVRRLNLAHPPMPSTIRRQLVDYYRADIRELETLLNRDLSVWLR